MIYSKITEIAKSVKQIEELEASNKGPRREPEVFESWFEDHKTMNLERRESEEGERLRKKRV